MNRSRNVTWLDPAPGIGAARRLGGIDYLRAIREGELPAPPFARLLGFELETIEDGAVTFAMTPDECHYNPFGVMHGGVAASLFDSALGCAVQQLLPAARTAPTMELHINYIRPITVSTGRIRRTGQVVHLGKRSATDEDRLDDSREVLDEVHGRLEEASERGIDISRAGEWLLYNAYIEQEHIREIRTNLPGDYYREVPKLAYGTRAEYPREYHVAIELIAHT